MTNAARAELSLAALVVNPRLSSAAERYAAVLARQDWFDHLGPDGSTLDGRAEAAGYLGWAYLGENLARGTGPADPAAIVTGWLGSAGHRANLLSPVLAETGVGCATRSNPDRRFWCVQVFGARRP